MQLVIIAMSFFLFLGLTGLESSVGASGVGVGLDGSVGTSGALAGACGAGLSGATGVD